MTESQKSNLKEQLSEPEAEKIVIAEPMSIKQTEQMEKSTPKVMVKEPPHEDKSKIVLQTLGEEPYLIDSEDEDANFISCRLGMIVQKGLKSQRLKVLQLRNNLITGIKGLDEFPNLYELQLYDNKILKIENLNNLLNLQVLDLSYNNIKKIENISHLKKLKKLYLLSNKIKKIENLDFPVLEMLELGSNKIKEIENLEGVASITSLFIGKNRISQIKNLHPLAHLEQIALGPNKLAEINEGLLPLKQTLKQLYMQENQISTIHNVNELTKLEILDISYNKVEHIQGIDQLTKLDSLYLTTNKIQNYEQLDLLATNTRLTTISLFGNDIAKEPGYRMKLVGLLPLIDDIDGTPMKTTYNVIFSSQK